MNMSTNMLTEDDKKTFKQLGMAVGLMATFAAAIALSCVFILV